MILLLILNICIILCITDHLSNNYKSYDNDHHYSGINHDSAISHQDDYDRINKWDNYDHKYDHNDHYGSNDFATSDDSSTKYKKKERSSRKILILGSQISINSHYFFLTVEFLFSGVSANCPSCLHDNNSVPCEGTISTTESGQETAQRAAGNAASLQPFGLLRTASTQHTRMPS